MSRPFIAELARRCSPQSRKIHGLAKIRPEQKFTVIFKRKIKTCGSKQKELMCGWRKSICTRPSLQFIVFSSTGDSRRGGDGVFIRKATWPSPGGYFSVGRFNPKSAGAFPARRGRLSMQSITSCVVSPYSSGNKSDILMWSSVAHDIIWFIRMRKIAPAGRT